MGEDTRHPSTSLSLLLSTTLLSTMLLSTKRSPTTTATNTVFTTSTAGQTSMLTRLLMVTVMWRAVTASSYPMVVCNMSSTTLTITLAMLLMSHMKELPTIPQVI